MTNPVTSFNSLKVNIDRRFLICPKCESEGRREVLGEFDGAGGFSVLRHIKMQGQRNRTTVVYSNEFSVVCGVCNEVVFTRSK